MAPSQIDDVDEVPHCRAVWGVPIRAEDVQHWLCPCQDCCNDWNQIARFLSRIFTQNARLVATDLEMLDTIPMHPHHRMYIPG